MLKHCYFHHSFVTLCPLFWYHATHPPGLIVVPSQCHAHRLRLTKIPTSISRAAASLDRPRPSSAEPQGSPVLQRLIAKVGEWWHCSCRSSRKNINIYILTCHLVLKLSHSLTGLSIYFLSLVFVSQQDGGSWSPEKRSSVPRHGSILSRRPYHDHEESSTSITSSGSTAPRRPTCRLQLH